jgi:YycE-like N-terminal domain
MGTEPRRVRWPAHLPAGALRVVRWSARYEETVTFYRDTIGLPVLETFHDSYGLDGTILGLLAGTGFSSGLPSAPGVLAAGLPGRDFFVMSWPHCHHRHNA